ncbi:MAG: relaxase domain-containing protein, partial [Mycobacteriaceae bacterium]
MSAGTGYKYLLRSTAAGDTTLAAGTALTAYYTASGTPAGRWYGTGLPGLGQDGARIGAGSVVSEAQLALLFGTGRDPLTGDPLGRGYRVYAPLEDRVARRVGTLPEHLDPAQREELIALIRGQEAARRTPQPVAGFDLTFTATKSISVLWALSNPVIQQAVL